MLVFMEIVEILSPIQITVLCLLLVFGLNKIITQAKYIFFSSTIDYTKTAQIKKPVGSENETLSDEKREDENELFIPALPENIEHIPYTPQRIDEKQMISNSNEFYARMSTRRTVRYFSPDPVSEDVIRNIIKTAGTSPSGAHTEPWTFVVAKDIALKREIRSIVEEEEFVNYTRRMGKKWTTDLKPFKTNWSKPYLTDAPYLILVFKQLYSFTECGEKRNHYYNEISVGIATGLLIAAIHYAGLVTLTSTPLNCGVRLREILGRPISEKLMLLFPVGFPSKDCTVPDLSRKKLNEICVEL